MPDLETIVRSLIRFDPSTISQGVEREGCWPSKAAEAEKEPGAGATSLAG